MLSFAKPQEPKKEDINLRALLSHTIQMVSNTARKKGIVIDLNYMSPNENIIADHAQLKQVLLNILMNSIQSIDHTKGKVTVKVDEVSGTLNYNGKASFYILDITDNGKGIKPEDTDKIFDPFYTTKTEGTGLGLSISYGIISRHGGEIEIESEVSKGTRVKIKLPIK